MDRSADRAAPDHEDSAATRRADEGNLAAGTMVGEYRIETLLGEGGMGRVYAAIHPLIAKRAAIKVLRRQLSDDPLAVERFVREARSVNEIGNPNIVDIFAFGTLPNGQHYFVMEWLVGESLRARLRHGRMSLANALDVLDPIVGALSAAHAAGIVHRDLKPDNVFLATSSAGPPVIKLLDFGVAKLVAEDASIERTATGALIGTPAYASPEQARGEAVDASSDLYALGALAFEMVTGEMVFHATSAAEIVARHLFEPPRRARQLRSDIPPALDALIVRLLAKESTSRPTIDTVREQLRYARDQLTLPVRKRSRSLIAAIVVGVVGIAVAAAIALWPSPSAPAPVPPVQSNVGNAPAPVAPAAVTPAPVAPAPVTTAAPAPVAPAPVTHDAPATPPVTSHPPHRTGHRDPPPATAGPAAVDRDAPL